MSKFGLRALKWPLSKAEVNEEVDKLEGYLTIFTFSVPLYSSIACMYSSVGVVLEQAAKTYL
jgi:hypothetical protein